MRPIDADAFLGTSIKEKRFVFETKDYVNAQFVVRVVYKDLAEALNNAPTLDVAPVRHGRWENGYKYKNCSVCGWEHPVTDLQGFTVADSYCPNCGAKMYAHEPPEEDET